MMAGSPGEEGRASDEQARPGSESIPPSSLSERLLLYFLRALAVVGAFLVMAGVFTGSAAWYTSRPQFCASCHIMEPYYTSWEHSSHSDVSCVKCHFPPGVGEKIRGKMLGLVQLAKYVTSTQGPRPFAEIPDASCLRSGCHDTRMLSGRVDFKGIPFDHAKHLGQMRRGKELRCTSCHSQIVQGEHKTVTESTCFLCHFKNGHFNEGLGACTRCHQIPESVFDLGGGISFHHDLAYDKGVDCVSCHGDLIRGNGEVPKERCTVCHNREDDLKRIDDDVFLHKTHVTDHKVDCLSCHLELHHSLDTNKIANAVSQCTACHPDHHQQQVAMLEGTGAKLIAPYRGNMTAARLSCFTCHKQKEVSPSGTVLMRASMATCIGCHVPEEIEGLAIYHQQLRELLIQLEEDLPRIEAALTEASLDEIQRASLSTRLTDVQHDASFLHGGNDIHNSHYASELTSKLLEEINLLCSELGIDPLEVQLPEKPVRVTDHAQGDIPTGKE
ncbi:MAG: NapC/NirT family cytochrome c [Pirellulaceae bacterium]